MHAPYTLCKVNATIPGTEYACKISYVSAKFSNFNSISMRSFIPSSTEYNINYNIYNNELRI